jgi:molecular chaperone GrpE (heat shock protein)
VASQLSQVLARRQIVPFDIMGGLADPELTEIVDRSERDDCQEGVVIEQVERGYKWEGKRLRRSKVIVAKRQEGR